MEICYPQGTFTSEDVVKYLNLTGQGNRIYFDFIKSRQVVNKAKALNLTVSDDDLQTQVDNLRIALGLHNSKDTLEFLSRAGLTVEDLERFCETVLQTEAVKDHLANDAEIKAYFINNRSEFDLARISSAIVKDENLTNEIAMQVNEEDEDFHKLARMHSLDEATKYAGGYVGLISRKVLPDEVSAKVFNAQNGDLLGPFAVSNGYQLILVEELIKPELDEQLSRRIREKIFDGWARQFMQSGIYCKA
jgi:peptidylprolyl isomerase